MAINDEHLFFVEDITKLVSLPGLSKLAIKIRSKLNNRWKSSERTLDSIKSIPLDKDTTGEKDKSTRTTP